MSKHVLLSPRATSTGLLPTGSASYGPMKPRSIVLTRTGALGAGNATESDQLRHVKQTVKHGGGSVMIWACMTAEGPGFMCKIHGNMDQYVYKSILEVELVKTI